ncbi:putative DNA helicase chromatin remodeling SNF2 family [Helianthus annuus]|uniref:DNA helicase chromatin remodeling SNF2 family n=1 Tax=Helianthus annuus TaxID=4232 RepID=A0A251UHE6_HELAN|nr:probable helicase CHR10 isoform X2 [Helianthus annuus]KAF5801133.1 putative DNA helicase chromatin remodeling SNF2 family [Helianthus annuus]KAJ0565446.1 putative DNA helicase chromatin remodeling SNF2 family [Helianthus annuus]KAJ0572439.1 putative DNA helicase chromatin remodeling SNF2 family [Helianthus annuus]KAJ0910560.1 putative DNA helicase chromatin remodeling SNF2 family [Helianthus annuus]
MNYEQRLTAAAKYVFDGDARAATEGEVNSSDYGVTAVLKPHQIEGLSWLIRRYLIGANVILGDEMGLGKTLQAISFLSYLKFCRGIHGPFLILCPLSVTDGWISEVTKFSPKLKVLRYVGDKQYRRALRREMYENVEKQSSSTNVQTLPFDVLLTTYDIALIDQDFLSQIPWHYAVIDEAQRLKNPSSVLYNVLRDHYIMPRRLLMTGTPIQNSLTELWALMHFCMPSVFGTLEQFSSTFKEGKGAPIVKEKFKSLKYVLAAFMLRRTKSRLIETGTLSLPPLTEITLMAPLVTLQKKVYMSILRKELPKLLALSSGTSNQQSLQNIVIQLRKACSHPYLFAGIEPEPYEEGEHLIEASGKLIVLDQLLQKLRNSGHRVLLFAQMTHTLDILQDYMELRKYPYERLDGSVRAEERFAAIRSFSRQSVTGNSSSESEPDPDTAFVFMISTRAGGVGLNLVAADTVIFYEQDWNPQVDKQALQRAHRIGQMNHVISINLVTERTVEEVIMHRAERKLQLSHDVIGEDAIDKEGKDMVGAEAGDLKSVVLGLRMFDPTTESNESSGQLDTSKVNAIVEKVIAFRHGGKSEFEDQTVEFTSKDLLGEKSYDPVLDEASYNSWVQKLKETSETSGDLALEEANKRLKLEEKHLKAESVRRKAEEKKLAKWEAQGYRSLSVKDVVLPHDNVLSDSGLVNLVYGDCTQPSKICPSEPCIIFSCVDDSGTWGHGGMFDALARLSSQIPKAYERASEFGDLHLGDLHLLEISGEDEENKDGNVNLWVALAVVQTYNPRRKVPRSSISIPELEQCLSKAAFSAAQKSASIHMPRIGHQNGSDRSEWYSVERLIRKYAALYGIKIYVYYFRRSS